MYHALFICSGTMITCWSDQITRFVTVALSPAFARLWHASTAKTAATTHRAAIEIL
jgi:hypothetical protein